MDDHSSARIGFIQARRGGPAAATEDTSPAVLTVEPAGTADAPQLIDVIAGAFRHDPTWSWALPDLVARRQFWKFCVDGALRYPWVFRTNGLEAVSVWIPPDGTELTPEDEEHLPGWLANVAGSRAPEVGELLRRFEEAHPRKERHYYLNLLATRDDQRGRGLGMALLKENLARIDAERMPAYLESSNPANDHRYQAVGFVPVVSFRAPGDGPIVTGMWRTSQ